MSEENTVNTGESCCSGGADCHCNEDENWVHEFEDYDDDNICPFCNIDKGKLCLMILGVFAFFGLVVLLTRNKNR